MIELDVRWELVSSDSGTNCMFTIKSPFACQPAKGDFIILEANQRSIIKINCICHYMTSEPTSVILLDQLECGSYDSLLTWLDWFKANYELKDVESSSSPKSYYVLYRNMMHLLGMTKIDKPIIDDNPHASKIIAETCRALILVENPLIKAEELSFIVQKMHYCIIEQKKVARDKLYMLDVIKSWDHLINRSGTYKWNCDLALYKSKMAEVFENLKSIPDIMRPKMD